MKKTVTVMMVMMMVAGIAMAESEVSISADVASAYVFRGSTFNDGVVLQPGMEVSGLPVTIGVWGNLDIDDYGDSLDGSEFSEIDIYASYDLPIKLDPLGLSVGYCEYTYPSGGGPADREVSLSASLETILDLSLAANYGIGGGIEEALYAEFGIGRDIEVSEAVTLSLSAALGYADPKEGESGLSHADVSAGISFGVVSVGVTYVAQIDDDVLPDVEDEGSYDADVVATLGVAYDF